MLKKLLGVSTPSVVVACACLGFVAWSAHEVFWYNTIQIQEENGLLEDIQAALPAIAAELFLINSIFEKRSDKLLLLFCALLCYCFCLREMDVETFDIPYIFILLGSGIGRNVSISIGFASILGYAAYSNSSHYLHASWAFIRSIPGVLIVYAGLCLVTGQYFEKHSSLLHHEYLEEIGELLAYVLLLLAAISTNSYLNKLRLFKAPASSTLTH